MTKGWSVSRRRPLFLRDDPAFSVQGYPIPEEHCRLTLKTIYLPVAFAATFLLFTVRAVPVLPSSRLLRRTLRWLNEFLT
jgi:hypothetical protein